MDRLFLFADGLISDLLVNDATLHVRRTGTAIYTLPLTFPPEQSLSIRLWTTTKGKITTIVTDTESAPAAFFAYTRGDDGSLCTLEAHNSTVHLEQLTQIHVDFITRGYLKTGLAATTKELANGNS